MGNIIVWLVILGAFGWMAFNYFLIRKAAKFVDNATFEELIRQGQLIDESQLSLCQIFHKHI